MRILLSIHSNNMHTLHSQWKSSNQAEWFRLIQIDSEISTAWVIDVNEIIFLPPNGNACVLTFAELANKFVRARGASVTQPALC